MADFKWLISRLIRRLQFPKAGLTPPGQGHGSDQRMLDFGLRLERALEGGEEGGELAGGFRVGEKSSGSQAVLMAITRGVGFADGGDRSAGFGAVGTGGGGTFFAGEVSLQVSSGYIVHWSWLGFRWGRGRGGVVSAG